MKKSKNSSHVSLEMPSTKRGAKLKRYRNKTSLFENKRVIDRRALFASAILFLTLWFSLPGKAQDQWTKMAEQDDVVAYYRLGDCGNQKFMFVKFENPSTHNLAVNWNLQIKTSQGAVLALPGAVTHLPPRSVHVGDCQKGMPNLRMSLGGSFEEQPTVTINMQVGH